MSLDFISRECLAEIFLFRGADPEFLAGERGFNGCSEEVMNMKTHFSNRAELRPDDSRPEVAEYCGLSVEVVWQMAHSSLIRYRDREFVIHTEDLCFRRSLRCAA